jgi:nucleotide-binding universal stress UspA family protein
MVTFSQVLCPIDFSDASAKALTYAAAFARWHHGHLTLLHVAPTFDMVNVQSGALGEAVRVVQPPSRAEVEAELRRLAERAGADTERLTLAAVEGSATATILDEALTRRAALVVMGTHGRGGFDRMLLGSVTEKVLRKAPCPVLTVPPHAPAVHVDDVAVTRILCAMDYSPAALQALGFALAIGRQRHAAITVLQVVEWLAEEEPPEMAHFNVAEFRGALITDAHERLRAVISEAAPGRAGVEDAVVIGRAHRAVIATAEDKGADLIVMGTQGRGAVGAALFGSTTQHVVRAASCPVLTVQGVTTTGT